MSHIGKEEESDSPCLRLRQRETSKHISAMKCSGARRERNGGKCRSQGADQTRWALGIQEIIPGAV